MERLKSHREFTAVLRRRRRVSSRDIVLHLLVGDEALSNRRFCQLDGELPHRRMGLAVSKSVGKAVTRNQVKRRFRIMAASHEEDLPLACDIVMRAKPSAAHASFASLDEQVAKLFHDVAEKAVNDRERKHSQQTKQTAIGASTDRQAANKSGGQYV